MKAGWAVTAQPRHGLRYEAGRLRVRPVLLVGPPCVSVVAAFAVWLALTVQSNPIAPAALTLPQAPETPVATTTLPAPTQWPLPTPENPLPTQWPLPTDILPPWLPIPTDEFNPIPVPQPQPPSAPRRPTPNNVPPDAPLPSNATPLPTPTAPLPTPPPAHFCDPRVDLCVH